MKSKTMLVSHIISIYILASIIGSTIFFIIKYNLTVNEIANAAGAEAIEQILKDSTLLFAIFVAGNFLLCTLIGAISCFLYTVQDKINSKMLIAKIIITIIPTTLLVVYLLIWMGLS